MIENYVVNDTILRSKSDKEVKEKKEKLYEKNDIKWNNYVKVVSSK